MSLERSRKDAARQIGNSSLMRGAALLFGLFTVASIAQGAQNVQPASKQVPNGPLALTTLRSHSRLALRLETRPTLEFQDKAEGFELKIKGFGFADLGAPFGEEKRYADQFLRVSDDRLKSVSFKEEDEGNLVVQGEWRFASGPRAPAVRKMEVFQYTDQESGRWIIDFWQKPGPTVAEVKAASERAARVAALKAAEEVRARKVSRQLASETRRRSVEDVQLYCKQPLTDDNSVFLKFKPYREVVDFHRWIPRTTADSGFSYFEPRVGEGAAKYVRLALKFYREGKFALVLRTLDFLETEVASNAREEYSAETEFLRANALLKLNLLREGVERLEAIKRDRKGTIVALHAAAFLAAREFAQGSPLAAVEQFQWLINEYPKHEIAWLFHLGVAESLAKLKETERARSEYQWVTENAPRPAERAEAALRTGDLYMDRFAYEQALAAYFQGIRYFEKQARAYPPIMINRAETLYQLSKFVEAKQAFAQFLAEYPAHPAGWRATYRIAEIEGRRMEAGSDSESRKWFYETVNRFPTSPGAVLARIRLIPCGDHAGLTAEAQERFFQSDAAKFDGAGEVVLSNYSDYRSLAHVRALINYGKESETVSVAIDNIRLARDPKIKQVLGSVLTSYFKKTVVGLMNEGKTYEALKFYQDKAGLIPRDLNPADPDYLMRLSQAAADMGMGGLAQQIYTDYETAMKPRPDATGRKLASLFEPATDTEAQLRASTEKFTRAKALWISARQTSRDEVEKLLKEVPLETPHSFESELILGLIEKDRGNPASALSHVQKSGLLARDQGFAADEPRMEYFQATLAEELGYGDLAIEAYREVERRLSLERSAERSVNSQILRNLGVPAVPDLEIVISKQADLLEKKAAWGEVAATYARAREKGMGGNRASFGYARALLKSGEGADRSKAMAALEDVAKSKTEDFWKKLAVEQLANEKKVKQTKEGRND